MYMKDDLPIEAFVFYLILQITPASLFLEIHSFAQRRTTLGNIIIFWPLADLFQNSEHVIAS